MNVAETLVFVGANALPTSALKAGCTSLVMCEDRNLQPHPPLRLPVTCRRPKTRCGHEVRHCERVSPCGFSPPPAVLAGAA